jgi:hypothetical protein
MSDTPVTAAPSTHIVDPSTLAPDLPPEKQAKFVEVLAQWGNVRAAAAQAGVSRAHLYRMRRASPEFRKLWDAALVLARPHVEEVLADRALRGIAETVYYHGEEVSTRIRYDTRLLLAHLGRLDRIEDGYGVRAAVTEFDERLEELRKQPPSIGWDDAGEARHDDGPEGFDADGPGAREGHGCHAPDRAAEAG